MAHVLRGALAALTVASASSVMLMAGSAHAGLTCTFGSLASCSGIEGKLKFSNFSATGSAQANDEISISLSPMSGVYSISSNYTPSSAALPLDGNGTLSFTVEALPGFNLKNASANADTLNQATPPFTFTSALTNLGGSGSLISTGANDGPVDFASGTKLSNVLITWAQGSSSNEAYGSSLRLTTNPPSVFVPAPLPILGAGAMFGFSRRLRRRVMCAQSA